LAQTLGIIGGGQLGMMLTEAAKTMPDEISDIIVLDPTKNCPATKVGAKQIVADFKDEGAIIELSKKSDLITYEIELGNSQILKEIEKNTSVNPSPKTLETIQDKYVQKKFLYENNLPVVDFILIESISDLEKGLSKFGFPSLLKLRKGAYDGRGNYKINNKEDVRNAYQKFEGKLIMLEKFVDFKMEVSVIAARNTNGQISTYPLVENIHKENILEMTIAPARVSEKIKEKAKQIAEKTMDVLQGAGVFGIEMFVTQNDDVLINEIAPRVHNSGHHTLQSSATSQFVQHLRAILGLELGSIELLHNTIMCNILGPKNFSGRYKEIKLNDFKNVYLKMYQKVESRPQRKLGHFNLVDSADTKNTESLIENARKIKNSIKIEPI